MGLDQIKRLFCMHLIRTILCVSCVYFGGRCEINMRLIKCFEWILFCTNILFVTLKCFLLKSAFEHDDF